MTGWYLWNWKRGSANESLSCRTACAELGWSAESDDELETLDLRPEVKRLLRQGRAAWLLQQAVHKTKLLSDAEQQAAWAWLRKRMAHVPAGHMAISGRDWRLDAELSTAHHPLTPVDVPSFWIDRFAVTNVQYAEFVRDDGYRDPKYWHQEIQDARSEFVDQTGAPGPAYWQNGTFPDELAHHPVVGVSWYEASAYATWAGKSLPTDAQWLMAASSGMGLSDTGGFILYPWGDLFDPELANVWQTGIGKTVPVYKFAGGDSRWGVRQLVGNVWEWTRSWFGEFDTGADFVGPTLWKSLRGGAFDTYFANQASCSFQSGDNPLVRRRNVGFRCVLDVDVLSTSEEVCR